MSGANNYVWSGSAWIRLNGAPDNADAVTVVTTNSNARVNAENYGFNGTTWDRLRSVGNNSDAVATTTLGIRATASYLYGLGFVGATWNRLRSAVDNSDTVPASGTEGRLMVINRNTLFNGATWDRQYSTSAANQGAAAPFATAVGLVGNWSVTNAPAVNVTATITRAGVAGQRHICTSIAATTLNGGVFAANQLLVLRDGAAGAGAILWSQLISGLVAGTFSIDLSALAIVGTAGNAMTLEFTLTPAAGGFQSVALTGYTTP